VQYDHTDGLGSPVALTDAAGKPISRTRYESYGLTAAGATPVIGFTGHVNAPDIGLVYMQQRYYDPVAGRFLSIDPVVTYADTGDSFNRYAYSENNPYRYVDPDGRQVLPIPLPPPPPVVTVTGQRPRSDPSVSPVQSSSQQGDPVARKLVEIYNKLTAPSSASPPPDDEDGPNSGYGRTTKGRSVENRSTNVGKDEFKRNLRENGWKESVSKDGQTSIFEKDGARYVIRENAKSTDGATADFYKANSSLIDVKIGLGGN
jgi:RHS repeat-associated protein